MSNDKAAAEKLFNELHPTVLPEKGSAWHWERVMAVAYANQNDLVDFSKAHTPRSRYWARVGNYAKARRDERQLPSEP